MGAGCSLSNWPQRLWAPPWEGSCWLLSSTNTLGRTPRKKPLSWPLASWPVLPEAPPEGPSPLHGKHFASQSPAETVGLPGPGRCSLTTWIRREAAGS